MVRKGKKNKGNKFENLDYGIYANAPNLSAIRTDVKYNTFTSMKNTGIYYTGVPYTGSGTFLPAPHNIANNNFNDCKNNWREVLDFKSHLIK